MTRYQVQYLHNETRSWMAQHGATFTSKAQATAHAMLLSARYKTISYRVTPTA